MNPWVSLRKTQKLKIKKFFLSMTPRGVLYKNSEIKKKVYSTNDTDGCP